MDLTPWEGLSKGGEQSGMSGESRVEEGAQLPEDGGFDVLEACTNFMANFPACQSGQGMS